MVSVSSIDQLPVERDLQARRLPLGPAAVLGCLGAHVAACNLTRLAVRARLTGPVAAVELILGFQSNAREPVESYFLFPLSFAASISRFRLQIGQRSPCEWQVVPKDQAANLQRHLPSPFLGALFAGEHQPVFCVPLGVVQPGEVINVDLAYAEQLITWGGDIRFSFPLTTSTRFLTGSSLEIPEQDPPPVLTPGLVPGPNFSISLSMEVAGAPPVRLASSHPIASQQLAGGELGLEMARQELSPRDFTLSYRLGQEKVPQGILRHGPRHFLYHLHPPQVVAPNTLPRHQILLMDISENAQGARLEMSRNIAALLLNNLGPGEMFSLVGFNHQLTGYETGMPCEKAQVPAALQWLQGLKASGRPNMGLILERVLELSPDPSRGMVVTVLACGRLGNEPELYSKLIEFRNPIRFNCIGIDNAVNHSFLRRLAGHTRGQCLFVGVDALSEMHQQKILSDSRSPLISDVALVDQGLGVNAETFSPGAIPGLSIADMVTVLGLKSGNGGLEVRGRSFSGQAWSEQVAPVPSQNPAIGVVWAHHKAREMSDELKLITGPHASRLRDVSAALSRDYRLMGDHTASVLVDPSAPGGAIWLPPLHPPEWNPEVPIDTTKNVGKFSSGRVQLPPPPPIEDLPPRPPSAPAMEEPPQATAAPVEPEEEPTNHSGLKIKSPILTKNPKIQVKQKFGGPKAGTAQKPMMKGSAGGKRLLGGKPVLNSEARAAAAKSDPVVEEGPTSKHLPKPNLQRAESTPEPTPEPTPAAPPPPPVAAQPQPQPQANPQPVAAPPGEGESADDLAVAKQILSGNAEIRQAMMVDLKALYQFLAASAKAGAVDPQVLALLERILRRLQPLMGNAVLLKEAYRVGVLCYQAVRGQDPQALAKTQHWVQRFAKLF